jgi:hypothetical protein
MTGQVPMWQESPGVAPAPAAAPSGVPPHGRCDRGKPTDATAHRITPVWMLGFPQCRICDPATSLQFLLALQRHPWSDSGAH